MAHARRGTGTAPNQQALPVRGGSAQNQEVLAAGTASGHQVRGWPEAGSRFFSFEPRGGLEAAGELYTSQSRTSSSEFSCKGTDLSKDANDLGRILQGMAAASSKQRFSPSPGNSRNVFLPRP